MVFKPRLNVQQKIAKVINTVNKYNANHNHRDMDGLVKKLFGDSDSLRIAYNGDPASDNYKDYLLTVVPVWCRDLDALETANKDDLNHTFKKYYYASSFIPDNMHESDLTVQVLSHDYQSMTSQVMDLAQFVKVMTESMQCNFQVNELEMNNC